MATIINSFFDNLLSIVFPKNPLTTQIESVTWEEFVNQTTDIRIRPISKLHLPFEVFSLFSYEDLLVRQAIWELKYNKNKKSADLFSRLLMERLPIILEDEIVFYDFRCPIIVPIPSSPKKRTRGFNQIELIADSLLKKKCEMELCAALQKTKDTGEQRKKRRTERLRDQIGCFKVKQNCETLIQNRNIIILDDVLTTGGTLIEAYRALKTARARRIIGLTLAH
jgi:competence protein ComFC